MTPRRETNDADSLRIDLQLCRVSAHQPHGALRILQRYTMAIGPAFAWQAIAQHGGGDARGIEALGDLQAIVLDREEAVAAARNDEQRAAVRLLGSKDCDVRRGNASDPDLPVTAKAVHRRAVNRQAIGRSGWLFRPQCDAYRRRPLWRSNVAFIRGCIQPLRGRFSDGQ